VGVLRGERLPNRDSRLAPPASRKEAAFELRDLDAELLLRLRREGAVEIGEGGVEIEEAGLGLRLLQPGLGVAGVGVEGFAEPREGLVVVAALGVEPGEQ